MNKHKLRKDYVKLEGSISKLYPPVFNIYQTEKTKIPTSIHLVTNTQLRLENKLKETLHHLSSSSNIHRNERLQHPLRILHFTSLHFTHTHTHTHTHHDNETKRRSAMTPDRFHESRREDVGNNRAFISTTTHDNRK